METVTTWIRAVLTALLLGLAIWWLWVVGNNLNIAPTVDTAGKVLLDTFQRSKDILLVVLPLLTTALGYWFGAAGKAQAEDKAAKAQTQLTEVLDKSTESGLLAQAKVANPTAFGLPAEK